MTVAHYTDYRDFLKAELERRIRSNTRYSLRAFARDLKLAPQTLSAALNGKKGFSAEMAVRISERLALSPEETSYFHDLVEMAHARSESVRKMARFRLSQHQAQTEYRTLQEDFFRIISDWQHYAILELTFTSGFKNDPAWIGKRLGISTHEAKQAIDRLLRLELLEEIGGILKKTDAHLTTPQDIPSSAVRKFTSKMLEKAGRALETQDVSERDFSTMTMAIDPADLPQAKEMLRKFRRDLTAFLERGARKEVYLFASQLFRLSESGKSEGENERGEVK